MPDIETVRETLRAKALGVRQLVDKPFADNYATFRGWVRWVLAVLEWRVGRLRSFEQVDFGKVRRLVFVCHGNICRSCFAEALARQAGLPTASFGLSTSSGLPAFPGAIRTAKRFGIDLDGHRVTSMGDFRFADGDLLVAMEVRQVRRLQRIVAHGNVQMTLLGLWSTPFRPHLHDPYEHGADYFDTCFRAIRSGVETLGARLKAAAERRGDHLSS